jgi:acetylglutamate kinase
MPDYTSYIMTNINDMIAELFTNIGKGTYFKISERVLVTSNLKELDVEKIKQIIEDSFEKKLKSDFFTQLEKRSPLIYLTENHSALAIVTATSLKNYNYLDKLCVTTQKQVSVYYLCKAL